MGKVLSDGYGTVLTDEVSVYEPDEDAEGEETSEEASGQEGAASQAEDVPEDEASDGAVVGVHNGGGWYEAPDGTKWQGKGNAPEGYRSGSDDDSEA